MGTEERRATAFFSETTVWEQGEDNAWPYHVYGLVRSKQGTLLAFAEGRASMHDHDPHHLVVKRSEDGGRSWSKNIYIEKADGAFWRANGQPGKLEAWTNTGPWLAGIVDQQLPQVADGFLPLHRAGIATHAVQVLVGTAKPKRAKLQCRKLMFQGYRTVTGRAQVIDDGLVVPGRHGSALLDKGQSIFKY